MVLWMTAWQCSGALVRRLKQWPLASHWAFHQWLVPWWLSSRAPSPAEPSPWRRPSLQKVGKLPQPSVLKAPPFPHSHSRLLRRIPHSHMEPLSAVPVLGRGVACSGQPWCFHRHLQMRQRAVGASSEDRLMLCAPREREGGTELKREKLKSSTSDSEQLT